MSDAFQIHKPHDRIIFVRLDGAVTEDTLNTINERLISELSATRETRHIVADFSRTTALPTIGVLRQQPWLRHPCTGWIVAVGLQSVPLRMMLRIVKNLYPLRTHTAESLDDALDYLRGVDASLDDAHHPKVLRDPSQVQQSAAVHRYGRTF